MACRGIDEQVVRHDKKIGQLTEQFVTVRLIQGNGLDLSLFQFDYDLTFAVFFLNADKTIYGRYGTRSDTKEADRDISVDSLAKAMEAALTLHQVYPANRAALTGKNASKPKYPTPEKFPSLSGKYTSVLDNSGKNIVSSCIHCHQIRDADRQTYRAAGKPMPDEVLFPYPLPQAIGLKLDPKEKAKVTAVSPGTIASRAGIRVGDEIASLQGQPIISIADVQWVLHHAGSTDTLRAEIFRGAKLIPITVTLPPGWRKKSDISWRVSSWNLRRMAFGGMLLGELEDAERRKLNIASDKIALLAKHVGQYGEHAQAKRAGFRKGDIIVAVEGRTDKLSETQLFEFQLNEKKPGTKVPVTVLRDRKRLDMQIPTQK